MEAFASLLKGSGPLIRWLLTVGKKKASWYEEDGEEDGESQSPNDGLSEWCVGFATLTDFQSHGEETDHCRK